MQKNVCKKESGFTLIELMIVIAIIGILAAIAIPNFISYRDKSYCSTVEADVHNVSLAATGYLVDNTNLSGFSPVWSENTTTGGKSLTANGTLKVWGKDASGRCPEANFYVIEGGQSSGNWSSGT